MAEKRSVIAEHVDRELIRALVVHQIFCPRNGTVLDMQTCVVFRDADGDPRAVMSQSGYAELVEQSPESLEILAQLQGVTVDTATVKS